MKKNLLLIFGLFITIQSMAQMSKVNQSLAAKMMDEQHQNRAVALFVKGDINTIKAITSSVGGYFKYFAGDIASVIFPVSKVEALVNSSKIESIEDSYMKIEPMLDSLLVKNNIIAVHNGVSPLSQGYDGTGVVMGIIDSGIDFTHPDFKDASNHTRVKYIWDHNLSGGTTPQPYNYGREFSAADIDGGLASAHVDNYYGHGTHVSGVAASNGRALNRYPGVAPNVDIISVCLNWNLADNNWLTSISDAVRYIFDKATAMGKPCVINISAGTYYGSHDAKDNQAQLIENLITQQNGRAVVVAAGNAGSIPFHMQYNSSTGTDTSFTWFNTSTNPVEIELWGDQANFTNVKFAIGADKISPDYSFRGQIPFTNVTQHLGVWKYDTVYNTNGNRLGIVRTYASLSNGRYSMYFRVTADSVSPLYNWRLSYTGPGKFDTWNFQMVYNNLPTVSAFPDIAKYHSPDLNQTIVSSFTCSDKVITVGEYINKKSYIDCQNGNQLPYPTFVIDSLSSNSSHGPTRIGIQKPDITGAGGITMAAAVLAGLSPTNPKVGEGCMHIRDGGTSTASPGVAGVAALYFQRYPNANWLAVKNAINLCNKRDNFTGLTNFPKVDWGYGKVDGFAALTGCAALGVNENEISNSDFFVSPNPFSDQTTIHFDFSKTSFNQTILLKVFDVLGHEVRSIKPDIKSNSIFFKKNDLQAGVYLISVVADNKSLKTLKMVIY